MVDSINIVFIHPLKSENLGQKMKEDRALDFLCCFFAKFDNE